MKTVDLIYPERSAIPFKALIFPDVQPHIKLDMPQVEKIDRNEPLRIFTRLNNANDLMMALLMKNTLDYLEFEQIELHVSYPWQPGWTGLCWMGSPFL